MVNEPAVSMKIPRVSANAVALAVFDTARLAGTICASAGRLLMMATFA
jgi:hypothetical protein